ncbi:MAG TPA: hypothetical protein VM537_02895 [Anaerolineae bacterium]|nr:hypothetical protein [Anaerolineae bacterium]
MNTLYKETTRWLRFAMSAEELVSLLDGVDAKQLQIIGNRDDVQVHVTTEKETVTADIIEQIHRLDDEVKLFEREDAVRRALLNGRKSPAEKLESEIHEVEDRCRKLWAETSHLVSERLDELQDKVEGLKPGPALDSRLEADECRIANLESDYTRTAQRLDELQDKVEGLKLRMLDEVAVSLDSLSSLRLDMQRALEDWDLRLRATEKVTIQPKGPDDGIDSVPEDEG